MRSAILILAATLAIASPATAQDRDPAQRQTLIDLAYVLGEAHALRQICEPGDQHWRGRMLGMVDAENGEHGFAERLRSQFNTGYVARQSQFTACTPESRKAEADVASRGAGMARRMGSIRIPAPTPPDSLAPGQTPG